MILELGIVAQVTPTGTSMVNVSDQYTVLQPILLTIATAAASVVAAAGVQAIRWLQKKLNLSDDEATLVGLNTDAAHRDALQTALTNAAGIALNALGNDLKGKTINVNNPAVAAAVTTVIKSVPDAIDHYDLGNKPDVIAQKIIGKMSQMAAPSTPAAS